MSTLDDPSEPFELHEFYNDLAQDLDEMKGSFIGNATLDVHFKQVTKINPRFKSQTIEFQSTSSNEIYTTNIFGEMADDLSGTRFGANGNIPIGDNRDVCNF
jgi:hypothetical protein